MAVKKFRNLESGGRVTWEGGHGLHVYDSSGKEVDYYSVGDFAKNEASPESVKRGFERIARQWRGF